MTFFLLKQGNCHFRGLMAEQDSFAQKASRCPFLCHHPPGFLRGQERNAYGFPMLRSVTTEGLKPVCSPTALPRFLGVRWMSEPARSYVLHPCDSSRHECSGSISKIRKTLETNFRNLRQFSSRRRCHALLPTQPHLQAACWFILSLSFPGPGELCASTKSRPLQVLQCLFSFGGSTDMGRCVAELTEPSGLNA